MKNWIMFLCAAALMLTACEKEEPNNDDTLQLPKVEKIPNAVTDIDGNVYDAIKIGRKVWMASNLRTTHFANGDTIPVGEYMDGEMPYRYAPGGNEGNVPVYGYLYNGMAAMHGANSSDANPSGVQGVCPDGWHIPSDAEWNKMEAMLTEEDMTLDGWRGDHAILLAGGGEGTWEAANAAGEPGDYSNELRNAVSFSALPAGTYTGSYQHIGEIATFWTCSTFHEPMYWGRTIFAHSTGVQRGPYNASMAVSVRCVCD